MKLRKKITTLCTAAMMVASFSVVNVNAASYRLQQVRDWSYNRPEQWVNGISPSNNGYLVSNCTKYDIKGNVAILMNGYRYDNYQIYCGDHTVYGRGRSNWYNYNFNRRYKYDVIVEFATNYGYNSINHAIAEETIS